MENAPFFRDPAGLAPTLGLTLPMTYIEWKEWHERRVADATKEKQEQNATAERDALIVQAESNAASSTSKESVNWQFASELSAVTLSQANSSHLFGWGRAPDGIARLIMDQLEMRLKLQLQQITPWNPVSRQDERTNELAGQWSPLAKPEHERRLAEIEIGRKRRVGEAQAQYQQRMDAIAAEHARTFAEIEARYAGK